MPTKISCTCRHQNGRRDTMEEGALICKPEKRAARYSDCRLVDSMARTDRAYTTYEHSSSSHESLQGLAVTNRLGKNSRNFVNLRENLGASSL
jgi:hypothetical protein